MLAAVVAGSAVAAVLALRGDGGTGTPTAAQESPSSPDPGAATGDYASLVARIPSAIRPDCHEATNALSPSAAAYVTASAVCRTSRDGSALEVTYDAVRGNAEVATTYRREVLGIGGRNHAPGNCRTRERDPQTRDRSALRGLYMPIGTTELDVEAWCDWAGPMYLLQPDDTSSIYVSLRRDGDDGNVSMQEQRYADLLAVRPL